MCPTVRPVMTVKLGLRNRRLSEEWFIARATFCRQSLVLSEFFVQIIIPFRSKSPILISIVILSISVADIKPLPSNKMHFENNLVGIIPCHYSMTFYNDYETWIMKTSAKEISNRDETGNILEFWWIRFNANFTNFDTHKLPVFR